MHERDVIERIFKRIIETPTGCWMVDGWSDGKGYRNISINGKTCKVHRVMFEWFWRRKLRKNVQVDHKCCNRSCCNPLHLQSCMNKKNAKLRDKRKRKNGKTLSLHTDQTCSPDGCQDQIRSCVDTITKEEC